MEFYGLKVNDLEESIIASGLPMRERDYTHEEWDKEVCMLQAYLDYYDDKEKEYFIEMVKTHTKDTKYNANTLRKTILHMKRAMNLGGVLSGTGHDSMLKGILVSVNIKADQSFWLQWERYHFQDTVSSMSTMHRILKFDVDKSFSEYVDPRSIEILKKKIAAYEQNKTPENFHQVIHNIPEGIELTRRVTTNYLQLKTMYHQRKAHKMFSWRKDFIKLCDELPWFYELIGIEPKEETPIYKPKSRFLTETYVYPNEEEWKIHHKKLMESNKGWKLIEKCEANTYGEDYEEGFVRAEYERELKVSESL